MFLLSSFAGRLEEPSLLIPLFVFGRRNEVYVHTYGRDNIIDGFLEWGVNEDLLISYDRDNVFASDDLKYRNLGDQALFPLLLPGGGILVCDLERLRRFYNQEGDKIRETLAEMQLLRLIEPTTHKHYSKFEKFGKRIFRSDAGGRIWTMSQLSMAQQHESLWKSIEKSKDLPRETVAGKLNEIYALDIEEMIEWLTNHLDDKLWPLAWLGVEERIGLEDRMEYLGVQWLTRGNEEDFLDYIYTSVLHRLLMKYSTEAGDGGEPSYEFSEWLVDVIEEEVLFSTAVGISTKELFQIYRLIFYKLETAQRVYFLTKVIVRGNCDIGTLSACLQELANQVADMEPGYHEALRKRINDVIVNNRNLKEYRQARDIGSSLKSIKKIMDEWGESERRLGH